MLGGSLPWSRALRAGLATYLGATLAVALLLGTYWAGHSSFPGHQHPVGTPEHTHTLAEVVGARIVPTSVLPAQPALSEFMRPERLTASRAPVRPGGTVLARAPPRLRAPRPTLESGPLQLGEPG